MARRKVRNYISIEDFEEMINNYFNRNSYNVKKAMYEELGFDSLDDLWNYEYTHCGLNCDCGFVRVKPKRPEQLREWRLDSGYVDWAYASRFDYPYNTQSSTCKKVQMEMALRDLNLTKLYYIDIRLD